MFIIQILSLLPINIKNQFKRMSFSLFPSELVCFIFVQLGNDPRNVIKIQRVSKLFFDVAQYVLNHNFGIKRPRRVKRLNLNLNQICHYDKYQELYLFVDFESIREIDIVFLVITKMSIASQNWHPCIKSINYPKMYYIHPSFSETFPLQFVFCHDAFVLPNKYITTQKELDQIEEIFNKFKKQTVFIEIDELINNRPLGFLFKSNKTN